MKNVSEQTETRTRKLVNEVVRGEYIMDTLINSAYKFEEEMQAMYFSNMQKNMYSDMADAVMSHEQSLEELGLLKGWGYGKKL